MMLVKTKVGSSQIEGLGIFADEFIPKDTVLWKYVPDFDLTLSTDRVKKLPEPGKSYFLRYAYLNFRTNEYILCGDNGRYFNHSDSPNTMEIYKDGYGIDVASQDIHPGEEMTTNYKGFDGDFERKMRMS